jgi:hypothetical protein
VDRRSTGRSGSDVSDVDELDADPFALADPESLPDWGLARRSFGRSSSLLSLLAVLGLVFDAELSRRDVPLDVLLEFDVFTSATFTAL